MKAKITMIDPPEGWKFGFPKPIPQYVMGGRHFIKWLLEQGYPALYIDKGYHKYCRYWQQEVEDES